MYRKDAGLEAPPGVPRWVKGFAIACAAFVFLIVLVMTTGLMGHHGSPLQHVPGAPSAPLTQP
jgi:hypothetical protein